MSDAATATPNAHAEAMNEMIESTHKAEAEASRLKRKYEPDEAEVLLDQILELSNDDGVAYMRVKILTGEYMMLTLIPSTRNNGNVPDWEFKPSMAGMHDYKQDFGMFGIYRVYVGNGCDGHELLVTFDHKGVRIRELETSAFSGDLTIKELPDKPEFALTCARAQ
eukprot:COSAG01_NODE_10923_length_2049_cov_8.108718_3_plen_166_part_00